MIEMILPCISPPTKAKKYAEGIRQDQQEATDHLRKAQIMQKRFYDKKHILRTL
jgi:hypothetical protein